MVSLMRTQDCTEPQVTGHLSQTTPLVSIDPTVSVDRLVLGNATHRLRLSTRNSYEYFPKIGTDMMTPRLTIRRGLLNDTRDSGVRPLSRMSGLEPKCKDLELLGTSFQ